MPLATTVEVLKLQGNKCLAHSIFAGRQTLNSSLFPGREISLNKVFRFPSRS
jgi:hypothetical protein